MYWLNPEPRPTGTRATPSWGSTANTDGIFECRNLRQLEAFVDVLE